RAPEDPQPAHHAQARLHETPRDPDQVLTGEPPPDPQGVPETCPVEDRRGRGRDRRLQVGRRQDLAPAPALKWKDGRVPDDAPGCVCGSPTTAMRVCRVGLERSKRLLLTGDPVDGRTAVEWGLASEAVPQPQLDDTALALARRVARLPSNQLHMMKLLVNQAF